MAALTSLGVMSAAAQGPVAYLDNQTHTIAANTSQLFRFDYAIDTSNNTGPITTIRLVNGTNSGLGFEVWTADQLMHQATTLEDAMADRVHNQPVGRGTPQSVNCDSGVVNGSGDCKSPDLVWSGSFGSSGPYFVKIVNNNNAATKFQLMIQGSGVSLQPQVQVAAAQPNRQPAAAPALAATIDDPSRAVALDTQAHALPANSATWYRFDYAIQPSDYSRPLMTIRLVNGQASGVNFEIWTADQLAKRANTLEDAIADPAHNQPIGRGTAQTVNCDSGVVNGSGSCKSNDLTWTGTFGTSGTYFIRVVNSNPAPANYQLLVTTQ